MKAEKNKCNRVFALLTALLLVFQIFMPSVVYADLDSLAPQMTSFDISFNADGTANITGYKYKNNSNYTSVVIPNRINGVEITGISDRAFYRSGYLKSIVIPDTVKNVGNYSFSQCVALKEVTIPGSVSSIGNYAFMSCKTLEKVYVLFGVQSIGNGAFADCSNLSQIAISPSTTSINERTFQRSGNVEIQANPNSSVWQYKDYEGKVTLAELPADSPSAYKYIVDENTGEVIIEGYVGINETPIVPDKINGMNVAGIGNGAFQNKPITQVTLPNTIRTIGSNAFAGTKLTVVEIPSSVTGIGEGAFNDDSSVTLKGDTSAIDKYLQNAEHIKFIPWGPGRTKYHEVKFNSNPALGGTIVQGRSKEYKEGFVIDIEAKPTTPANVGSADKGQYLFKGWTVSGNITDGTSLDSVIENKNLSKTKITMPAYPITVTANYELMPPNPLVIKDGVVVSYTGNGMSQLVINPEWREEENGNSQTVHTIGLSNVNGGVVFLDSNMKELDLPYTITKIHSRAFNSASGLEKIVVAKDNKYFETDEYGVLYNKGKTKLLAYPQNRPGDTYEIPDSVTEIGDYAFYNNRNLVSINFNNVKIIGSHAFENSVNLSSVDFAGINKIGSYAFANSNKIEYITIPSSVTYLGTYVFYNCKGLKMISWGETSNIKSIPAYAFAGTSIISPKLPNGIEEVCDYAFAYCNELNAVIMSRTIKKWYSNALYGSNNITIIDVEDENPYYSSMDGVLFNKEKTVLVTYPAGKEGDVYTVPDSVVTIADNACGYSKFNTVEISNVSVLGNRAFGNSKIQSINLEKMTDIDAEAFYNCSSLKEIEWPAKINIIPSNIFRQCNNLEKIIIPESVTSINENAFYNCTSLKSIDLPSSLSKIGRYAFYNCTSIQQVDFPDKLTSIDYGAFSGCRSLTSVIIPKTVTSLGGRAFSGCLGLESVTMQGSGRVPDYAFSNCKKLIDLKLSENITAIGDYAFYNCIKLSSITLSENIKSIGASAFYNCTGLVSVILGADIGDNAFGNCTALENITLLDTVKNIGTNVFYGCNRLKSIDIPASVQSIGEFAFNYCEALENITVNEENTVYSSDNGILFNNDKSVLILYPQNKEGTSYRVIDSVTSVSDYAFDSVNNLTDVDFVENVSDLGLSVFRNAPNIKNITIRNKNVSFASTSTYPAKSFFYGIGDDIMKNLIVHGYMGSTTENEVFVHRVKGIKFMALDPVTKGLVIQKIEKKAEQRTVDNLPLGEKTWLGEVVGYEVPSSLSNTEEAKNIIVPSLVTNETEGLIIKDENGNVISLNDGESIVVSSLGFHSLWYPGAISSDDGSVQNGFVKAVKSVLLPQTITDIKSNAFDDCTGLSEINIPVSVQNIHAYAFRNCSALTEVTIPKNVVMLGEDKLKDENNKTESHVSAFEGCINLKKINVEEGNNMYASVDGVLMNFDKNKIYEAPNGFTGNVDSEEGKYIVPDGVETIGSSAFVGCKLNSVEFSDTVKHIGVGAFKGVLKKDSNNSANSTIIFADSKDEVDIDNEAFADCTGLTEINLPVKLCRVGDDAFARCTSLRNFNIPEGAEDFCTIDGVLFGHKASDDVESYYLLVYPMEKTDTLYTVPDSIPVREIYKSAFQNNEYLKEFSCSKDLQIIGESAFRDCADLNNIQFGENIWKIDSLAFRNTALAEVSIPKSVVYIGQEAFAGCKLLNSVEIHNKNAEIAADVFKDHNSSFVLKGTLNSNAEQYAKDNELAFEYLSDDSNSVLYSILVADNILNGSVSLDKQTAEKNDIINITVIPDEGYRLVENSLKYNETVISADDNGNYSFEMPEKEVIITAEFEPITDEEKTFVSSDDNEKQQSGGSDNGEKTPVLSDDNEEQQDSGLDNDKETQVTEQTEVDSDNKDSSETEDENVSETENVVLNNEMPEDFQDLDMIQESNYLDDDSEVQDSE